MTRGEPVDLWAAADTTLGKMATGPSVERWVQEEYERLSAAAAGSGKSSLFTDGEVQALRQRARTNVLSRLQREGVTVAEDDPLEAIRAEFAQPDCDVDVKGALQHAKAELVLAAAGRELTERNYLAALHAVDSETARRTDETEIDGHLLNAQLLSDAAERELYARGITKSNPAFADLFVAEIESLARESGLTYGV
jgi:hypothetical protein